MPKARPPRERLHQVFVEDKVAGLMPVSPKMAKDGCEMLKNQISKAISAGKLPNWTNPHVVLLELYPLH